MTVQLKKPHRLRRANFDVPAGAHPLVRGLYGEARRQLVTTAEIARKAGLAHSVIRRWARVYNPKIDDLDAALNVLGLRLAILPLDRVETQETENGSA